MDGGTDETTRDAGGSAVPDPAGPGFAPPPPPPPPAPSPRQLLRRRDGRMLAGVATGLGDYFRIDPLFFRIGFVALTFAGGVGLLLYIAAWLLVPERGASEPIGLGWTSRVERRHIPAIAGAALLVIAFFIIAGTSHFADEGLIWGVALIAVGVLLLTREAWPVTWAGGTWGPPAPRSGQSTHAFSPTGSTMSPPATRWTPAPGHPAWAASSPQGRPATPVPPRPRSVLGLITVALAILVVGVATLLDNLGVISVTLGNVLALVLLVVGLGLIAGAWFGRSRALIVIAIAMVPFTIAASVVHEPFGGGAGDRTVTPRVLADLQRNYQLGAGQLTVDLSRLDLSSGATITASVALGQLTVVVPSNVRVEVDGQVGAGELDLLGHVDNGVQVQSHVTDLAGTSTSVVHLSLSVGLGQVQVTRAVTAPGVSP